MLPVSQRKLFGAEILQGESLTVEIVEAKGRSHIPEQQVSEGEGAEGRGKGNEK